MRRRPREEETADEVDEASRIRKSFAWDATYPEPALPCHLATCLRSAGVASTLCASCKSTWLRSAGRLPLGILGEFAADIRLIRSIRSGCHSRSCTTGVYPFGVQGAFLILPYYLNDDGRPLPRP